MTEKKKDFNPRVILGRLDDGTVGEFVRVGERWLRVRFLNRDGTPTFQRVERDR